MPYVEGFGTYPFGEEWLFDAVIRSYLPVLEVAERLTMTVTPVLADQLEDAGVAERLRRFLRRVADRRRRGRHASEVDAGVPRRLRGRAGALPARAGAARRRTAATRCAPFSAAAAEGRIALAASAATHAVLPLLATRAGPAACSSTPASARTGGASAGTAASGCPSAPTRRGSSGAWPSTA